GAAQAVELRRQPPAARARVEPGAEMAALRRDDESDFGGGAAALDREPVIAERQILGEPQLGAVAAPAMFAAGFEPADKIGAALPVRQAQPHHRRPGADNAH